ncbi:MAG: VanZ family protein [Anaerolineales bacterium]
MQIIVNDIGIPAWPIGILALIVTLVLLWRQKHSWSYLFFFSIFWVYVMSGLDKAFFPIQINGQFVDVMRQTPLTSHINLVPFYLNQQYALNTIAYINIVQNILLTMPFGFGLNFISRIKIRNFLWLSITIGLGIELIQLIISLLLQYPYRVIDINDAFLNAIGIIIGYGLFRGFAWLYLTMTHKLKIEHKGLSLYIYEAALQEQIR